MRTLSVFAPDKKFLEKWKAEFMKNKCEEFELYDNEDDGESLATKQDEHDCAHHEEVSYAYMVTVSDDSGDEGGSPSPSDRTQGRDSVLSPEAFIMMLFLMAFASGFACGTAVGLTIGRRVTTGAVSGEEQLDDAGIEATSTVPGDTAAEETLTEPAPTRVDASTSAEPVQFAMVWGTDLSAPLVPTVQRDETSPAVEALRREVSYSVRSRGRRYVPIGHEMYPSEAFLTDERSIERRPVFGNCRHEVLDRVGTNQHKRRFKCDACGGIWSG
jgi:hypothetical protein